MCSGVPYKWNLEFILWGHVLSLMFLRSPTCPRRSLLLLLSIIPWYKYSMMCPSILLLTDVGVMSHFQPWCIRLLVILLYLSCYKHVPITFETLHLQSCKAIPWFWAVFAGTRGVATGVKQKQKQKHSKFKTSLQLSTRTALLFCRWDICVRYHLKAGSHCVKKNNVWNL